MRRSPLAAIALAVTIALLSQGCEKDEQSQSTDNRPTSSVQKSLDCAKDGLGTITNAEGVSICDYSKAAK